MTAEETQPQTSQDDSQPDYKGRFDSLMAAHQRALTEMRQLKAQLPSDADAANDASDADGEEPPDERDARIAELEQRLAALESKPKLMEHSTPNRAMGGGMAPPQSELDALRNAVNIGVQEQWAEWKERSST